MGAIGKSTLAAQIATRVSRLQSGRVVTVVNGEVSASTPWPAETDLVILDNFDDNLSQDSGRWMVRDPELAARLLGDAERDQVWRLTVGHPLGMEYLDLLLARGERYQDLARRIEAAITAGTDIPRTEPTELPDATAEQIASAAGLLTIGPGHELGGAPAGGRVLAVPRRSLPGNRLPPASGRRADPGGRPRAGPDRGARRRAGRNGLLPPGSRHRHPGPAGRRPPAAACPADHDHAVSTGRAGCGQVDTRLLITLATRADLTPGPDGYVLTIEFGAPAPLGMLR